MNPQFGKYKPESHTQAGAFLDIFTPIGDMVYGVPDVRVFNREEWLEDIRAKRLLQAQYEADRKKREAWNVIKEPRLRKVTPEDLREAIYETWKSQPALQKRYTAVEYYRIRIKMLEK